MNTRDLLVAVAILGGVAQAQAASWSLTTVYAFEQRLRPNSLDFIDKLQVPDKPQAPVPGGDTPSPTLLLGRDEAWYGSTGRTSDFRLLSARGSGDVFRLDMSGQFKSLHEFSPTKYAFFFIDRMPVANADGLGSRALMQVADGTIYGTSSSGGPFGGGTIFKLDTAGRFSVVHAFEDCDPEPLPIGLDAVLHPTVTNQLRLELARMVWRNGCAAKLSRTGDQPHPSGALVEGADGAFYGTSCGLVSSGGLAMRGGVFRITRDGGFSSVHVFTGADGACPASGLVRDGSGHLYGITQSGGANDTGIVFRLDDNGAPRPLHVFGPLQKDGTNADGVHPSALAIDDKGYLIGIAGGGGSGASGVLFALSTNGAFSILHAFSATADKNINFEGASPSGLSIGGDGTIFGAASAGGAGGHGTVWSYAAGTFTLLHAFGANPSINDGETPGTPKQAPDGRVYLTVADGGPRGGGAVIALSPPGMPQLITCRRDPGTGAVAVAITSKDRDEKIGAALVSGGTATHFFANGTEEEASTVIRGIAGEKFATEETVAILRGLARSSGGRVVVFGSVAGGLWLLTKDWFTSAAPTPAEAHQAAQRASQDPVDPNACP